MSTTKTVKVKVKEQCPYCMGKTYIQEEGKGRDGWKGYCRRCGGTGELVHEEERTVTIEDDE